MTLDQLSAAASGGAWHHNEGGVTGSPWISTDSWTRENGEYVRGGCILNMVAHDERQQDAAFICALVNAYRTGQLVTVADDAIDREQEFCRIVWDALKGDHNDLTREQIILEAFRSAMKDTQP